MSMTKQAKPPDFSTGAPFIDYRQVTVEVYGIGKSSVGSVVSTIRQTFDHTALTIDNSTHMRTQPLSDNEAPDETQRDGEDVRKAVLQWIVWTSRSSG